MNMNKTRPGVYVNINAELTALTRDNLGVVAIPLALNWGAPGFTEIQQDQSPLYKLSAISSMTAPCCQLADP